MPFNTLFDAYVFVDWSAVSKPKFGADSIWIGAGEYTENGDLIVDQPANPATRRQAEAKVCDLLVRHVQSNRRVLVGFDFPYGYPANWNNAVGRNAGNWDALWSLLAERITDNNQNLNNRCEVANSLNAAVAGSPGPFWSRPNKNITLQQACRRRNRSALAMRSGSFGRLKGSYERLGGSRNPFGSCSATDPSAVRPLSAFQCFTVCVITKACVSVAVCGLLKLDGNARPATDHW